jgi:hypothetical protein
MVILQMIVGQEGSWTLANDGGTQFVGGVSWKASWLGARRAKVLRITESVVSPHSSMNCGASQPGQPSNAVFAASLMYTSRHLRGASVHRLQMCLCLYIHACCSTSRAYCVLQYVVCQQKERAPRASLRLVIETGPRARNCPSQRCGEVQILVPSPAPGLALLLYEVPTAAKPPAAEPKEESAWSSPPGHGSY